MIPHDYHMHTRFSCDSHAVMREMCASAVAKGIPEIGFTEHYDLHPSEKCRDWLRVDEWDAELERCRAEFAGRLTVRAGIELGEPHRFQTEAQAMLARYPFDYALGSLHWVGDESVFDKRFYTEQPQGVGLQQYFEELERMTRVGGFHILSHFDLPLRVVSRLFGGYDPHDHAEPIRAALTHCIQHGIALDINASLLKRKTPAEARAAANLFTPGLTILKWYAELGGERITLGSDAHEPQHLGAHLDLALEIAREAGLNYVTQFEGRQARLVKI